MLSVSTAAGSAPAPPRSRRCSAITYQACRQRGQAHVLILNVLYDDGTTYRDWQNQETPFQASGNDPIGPGWRLCTSPPATILESGTDAGNFKGVALWYEQGELGTGDIHSPLVEVGVNQARTVGPAHRVCAGLGLVHEGAELLSLPRPR
jgi:hypothetical protein